MTLEYFLSLPVEDWADVIQTHGVLIGSREDSRSNFSLYQIDGFYVEVAYQKSDGVLWKIGPFDHPVLLGPYLNQIDIQNLTQ